MFHPSSHRCILFPAISLVAYAHAAAQARALNPSATILQVSPPTFDPCIGDIASALYAKVPFLPLPLIAGLALPIPLLSYSCHTELTPPPLPPSAASRSPLARPSAPTPQLAPAPAQPPT
jgi:hypothetical protein